MTRPRILVLNGPNLNLLGTREPEVYGRETLADVERACTTLAADLGVEVDFRQSNHEGELVDWIHEAGAAARDGRSVGAVVNAGAYTAVDTALVDAITTARNSFRDDINTAQRVLGFTGTGILLLTVFAGVAVVGGLIPRIREYR